MTKYKCVKPLSLDTYGDDGFPVENEYFVVEIGSVWEVDETSYRFAAASDSTRLIDTEGRWMEIHDDTLTGHFVHV